MKHLILILLGLTFVSCKKESRFNLDKDLYQFSKKMENGDTIEIKVDHSACLFAAHEMYTFIKSHDSLFLETYSTIGSYKEKKQVLPKELYKIDPENPLSFESYFKYLKKEDRPGREYDSPLVIITYKNKFQTHSFNDDGLRDKFKKLDKLMQVRENIYPKDTFFKIPEPPPPPTKKRKS